MSAGRNENPTHVMICGAWGWDWRAMSGLIWVKPCRSCHHGAAYKASTVTGDTSRCGWTNRVCSRDGQLTEVLRTCKDAAVIFVDQLDQLHFAAELDIIESSVWFGRAARQ